MDSNRSRAATLIGVAAAAGAFGAAAMMSAAAAPAAHADDFTEILNAVESDYASGQADFGVADTDFGSSDVSGGLAALVSGADYDSLSAPQNLLIGTVEALTNETITVPDIPWSFTPVTSYAEGVTFAEEDFSYGQGLISDAATAFSSGDYGQAVTLDLVGADYSTIIALQDYLLGAAASF
jgi:hypothetical protein